MGMIGTVPYVVCFAFEHLTNGIVHLALIGIDGIDSDVMKHHTVAFVNRLDGVAQLVGLTGRPWVLGGIVLLAVEGINLIGADEGIFLLRYIGGVEIDMQREDGVTIELRLEFPTGVDRGGDEAALTVLGYRTGVVLTVEKSVLPRYSPVVAHLFRLLGQVRFADIQDQFADGVAVTVMSLHGVGTIDHTRSGNRNRLHFRMFSPCIGLLVQTRIPADGVYRHLVRIDGIDNEGDLINERTHNDSMTLIVRTRHIYLQIAHIIAAFHVGGIEGDVGPCVGLTAISRFLPLADMHRVELSFIGDKLQFKGVADAIATIPRTVGTLFVLDSLAEGIDLVVLHGVRPERTDQTVAAFLFPINHMILR